MPSGHPDWQPPRPAAGNTVRLIGANPAAGAQFTITVPAGEVWRPVGLTASLTTSAVFNERLVRLRFRRAGGDLVTIPAPLLQQDSEGVRYEWFRGAGSSWAVGPIGLTTYVAMPLPDITLVGADTIESTVVLMDVGDDWGSIVLIYELAA